MKMTKKLILTSILLAAATSAFAQGTKNDLETDLRTRTSISIEKTFKSGFGLSGDYQLRTADNISRVGRHQITIGTSYKINSFLKAGVGYTYIENQGSSLTWKTSHRFQGDITGTLKTGDWNFSLTEQVRYTHSAEEINPYQEVRNEVTLRSRVKAAYKGFSKLEPYAYVELRTVFNDPSYSGNYDAAANCYPDFSFDGYNDVYFNRYRGTIGLEWALTDNHSLDFYGMFDYCYEKDIKADKAGTSLSSITYDRKLNCWIGVGYTFAF